MYVCYLAGLTFSDGNGGKKMCAHIHIYTCIYIYTFIYLLVTWERKCSAVSSKEACVHWNTHYSFDLWSSIQNVMFFEYDVLLWKKHLYHLWIETWPLNTCRIFSQTMHFIWTKHVSFETCTERLSFESCAIPFKLETSLQEIERERKKKNTPFSLIWNMHHSFQTCNLSLRKVHFISKKHLSFDVFH